MKLWSLALASAAMIGLAGSANAAVIFDDNFQQPLDPMKWTNIGNGRIVSAPDGALALNFANTSSGSDLESVLFAPGAGKYRLKFDYFCIKQEGACAGYIGVRPGGSTTTAPASGDGWLFTDLPSTYGTPFTGNANGDWVTFSFDFDVTSPGGFGLKLEDFNGAGGNVAGDAYFRNLTVAAIPEPATWAMMIVGFGLIGGAARRRRHGEQRLQLV